ncbi:MAG TPA: L-rhamnose/proton symporter RhaT [Lachnospiraceae bacterium]|nr:L-rhamnose/proton symporter RhaT [Lachnospiraceae bacterium]
MGFSLNGLAIGFIVLLLAGICQGSFGIGYKRYTPLKWEAFWGVYSTFCLIVPLIWTFIQVPDFLVYLRSVDVIYVIIPIFCGILWGITAIGFSKAVDYIGISLVYGLSMGISAVVGSLIPLITMKEKPDRISLLLLIIGMVITLIGIAIITKAGLIKDKEVRDKSIKTNVAKEGSNLNRKDEQDVTLEELNGVTSNQLGTPASKKETNRVKLGLILALFSGLGSGAMNVGFNYANPIGKLIMKVGYNEIGASAVQWLLVLFGGSISGIVYCVYKLSVNHTWDSFTKKGAVKRHLILFLTSIVWFTALAAYGISTMLLGNMGSIVGWILFNALALIISNIWGLKAGEWHGAPKAKKVLLMGNTVLLVSWIFTGIAG